MGNPQTSTDSRQAGFTLVELAIVMIIIGLLIGGVLKGQELIANAQVTATVSQVRGIDAAMTTFRDTYASVPGDMINATTRLPNCNANCRNAPNATGGNNRVDSVGPEAAPAIGNENAQTWQHLAASDLLGGILNTGTMTFGNALPQAPIGGGFFIGYYNGTGTLTGSYAAREGHYLALTGVPNAAVGSAASDVLRPSQAERLDRKMDDGTPNTGTVVAAANSLANCVTNGNPSTYQGSNTAAACALYIRVQQ